MRGGGFGGTREKGITALAWISYALAVAGGAAAAATFVGGFVAGVVRFFPGWVAVAAFGAGFIAMAVDLFVDGTPNRLAIWMGILLPSVARAVPGRLGQTVTAVSNQVLAQINHVLGEWLGATSAFGVAVFAVAAALLVARRVVHKGAR